VLKSTNEKKEIHDVTIDVPSSYLIEINDTEDIEKKED